LFLRAAVLDEKSLGPESPELGTDLNNLGLLYLFMKRHEEAQKFYQRALSIRMKALGDQDPGVVETMNSYAIVLHALRRNAEAVQLEGQAQAILDKRSSGMK
jgi:tetratricopeptide (TPR) repeat protein